MTRKRDLTGFGETQPSRVTPPRPAPPSPAPGPAETPLVPPPPGDTTRDSGAKGRAPTKDRPKGKQRITLSLPTSVATLLRSTADRENRIYLDIILQAFVDHSLAIDQTFVERRRSGAARTQGGRRRADAGRTQIPLNILKEDLREIDRRAKALSLDRSTYVTELLVRSLAG